MHDVNKDGLSVRGNLHVVENIVVVDRNAAAVIERDNAHILDQQDGFSLVQELHALSLIDRLQSFFIKCIVLFVAVAAAIDEVVGHKDGQHIAGIHVVRAPCLRSDFEITSIAQLGHGSLLQRLEDDGDAENLFPLCLQVLEEGGVVSSCIGIGAGQNREAFTIGISSLSEQFLSLLGIIADQIAALSAEICIIAASGETIADQRSRRRLGAKEEHFAEVFTVDCIGQCLTNQRIGGGLIFALQEQEVRGQRCGRMIQSRFLEALGLLRRIACDQIDFAGLQKLEGGVAVVNQLDNQLIQSDVVDVL